MTNIATLRKMVNNGWTIANRKNILAYIDKSDLKDLTIAAKKSGIDIDDLEFDMFESHLKPRLYKTYIGDEEFIEKDFRDLEQMKLLIKEYKEIQKIIKTLPNGVNWNSEKYLLFKLLDPRFVCQDNNIKILLGTNSKVHTQLKDLLFKTCKPLGRTEIHYRKEGFSFNPYSPNYEISQKLFENIESLKVGDSYKPGTYLWSSANKVSTSGYGGFQPDKAIYYEIVYPAESKIIEYPLKTLLYGDATEAIAPRNSIYKILEKRTEGDEVFIKMQLII